MLIEKHFCRSQKEPGPDSAFSMESAEFREMVEIVRIVEKSIGNSAYTRAAAEEKSLSFRRSLFASQDIADGEPFAPENVCVIRLSDGLAPKHYRSVLEKTSTMFIKRGTPLSFDFVSEPQ